MPDTRARTEWIEHTPDVEKIHCMCGKTLDFSEATFTPVILNAERWMFGKMERVTIPARWALICPKCLCGHFKNAITESSYDSGWVKPHTTIVTKNKMPLNYGGFRMPGEKQPWTIFELRAFFYGVLAGTFGIGIATIIALHFLRKP